MSYTPHEEAIFNKMFDDYVVNDNSRLKQLASAYNSGKIKSDYANFHKPTDNIYESPTGGSTDDRGRPSIQELFFMGSQRIGLGHRICFGTASDAIRNWFKFEDINTKKVVLLPKIDAWIQKTDFKNQCIQWVSDARQYGVGFLVKYWGNNEDMAVAPPKSPPTKFGAISPLYLMPLNTYESNTLDFDEECWEFQGGVFGAKSKLIHRDRIEVLTFERIPGHWRGISQLEPIWLSLVCYYNAIIYSMKAVSKWGGMIPVMKSGHAVPTPKEYAARLEIMTEFVKNNFFILGRDDDLQFPSTNLGQGIAQIIEILKEDISSGTKIPLNQLFGRSVSGGIGGEGALTSERNYMNLLAGVQTSCEDDIWKIISDYWDVSHVHPAWNLALQKTSEQRIREEGMVLQNEIMEENLKMLKHQNKMMKKQEQWLEENMDILSVEEEAEQLENVSDFRDLSDTSNISNNSNKSKSIDYSHLDKIIKLFSAINSNQFTLNFNTHKHYSKEDNHG